MTNNNNKRNKFLEAVAIFLAKGIATGRWEVKWTWRF